MLCCATNKCPPWPTQSLAHEQQCTSATGNAAIDSGFCCWETSSPGNRPTSSPCPKGQAFVGELLLPLPHHFNFLSHFLCKQNLLLSTSLCLTVESLEANFFFLFLLVPGCPFFFCLPSKYPERIASSSFRILGSSFRILAASHPEGPEEHRAGALLPPITYGGESRNTIFSSPCNIGAAPLGTHTLLSQHEAKRAHTAQIQTAVCKLGCRQSGAACPEPSFPLTSL